VKDKDSDAPSAEVLKDGAQSGPDGEGMKGAADVTDGKAAFRVTQLAELTDYVLYAAAEAQDGTLSEVFAHEFTTAQEKIVKVSYEVEQDGTVHVVVKTNALIPTQVYWVLADEEIDGLEAASVRYAMDYDHDNNLVCSVGLYCGVSDTVGNTMTAEFSVSGLAPGETYFLYSIANGKQLSEIYEAEVAVILPED